MKQNINNYKTGINFLDLKPPYSNLETAQTVIIPVPFDSTSTWKKGADWGPAALIDASSHLELYDIETDTEVYKQGIYTHEAAIDLTSPAKMAASVYRTFQFYTDKKLFPVIIGGEHSVSIGAIQAASAQYNNLSVLQLDAHTDLRREYEGSKYNHACVMARAQECASVVQVGIRSMDISEKAYADFSRIFLAEKIYQHDEWMEQAIGLLSDNVYITVDLDVFDPAIMPATGTPEPGGLLWHQVLLLLKKVFMNRHIVGCDVVELCPGAAYNADFLAAKLLYKMLSYYFAYKNLISPGK